VSSTSLPTFACTAGRVCSSGIQPCRTNAECTGATCVSQQCTFGTSALPVQACGNVCNP
jgi:hypothetical protein